MKINTWRFGELDISEDKVVSFDEGLPGLENSRRFALLCFDDCQPISWLQSLDEETIALPVIDPFLIMPEYTFDIAGEYIEKLELMSKEDVHVLSVLVIPEDISKMTVNLAAPVIVNVKLRRGLQIFLEGGFSVREPVYSLIEKRLKEDNADAGADEEA